MSISLPHMFLPVFLGTCSRTEMPLRPFRVATQVCALSPEDTRERTEWIPLLPSTPEDTMCFQILQLWPWMFLGGTQL